MTRKADFFSGIGIVMISAFFFHLANQFPASSAGIGAGGYPKFVCTMLAFFGIVLSLQSYRAFKEKAADEHKISLTEMRGIALLALSFFLYLFSLRYLGYIIATPIFLFLFLYQYGDRKWIRMAAVSVIATAITYLAFQRLFLILLPRGNFF